MKLVEVGDILSNTKGIIVHGCNAQGVMGSGLAKQIKDRYPLAFQEYRKAYENGGLRLGDVIFAQVTDDLIIANAITQQNYGRNDNERYVSYKAIHSAFEMIAVLAQTLRMEVHYPLIGAGLANGDWAVITELIDDRFQFAKDLRRTLWVQD